MSSISSIETVTPRNLSPLPPSPTTSGSNQERTLLGAEPGHFEPDQPWKGKGRQLEQEHDGFETDDVSHPSHNGVYPPTNDDEAETRRVEENLRRWEVAERQKRKIARESASVQASPSLVGDMSRRTSLLWPGRKSRNTPKNNSGTHMALQSQENIGTPLQDINASPTPSPSPSPPPDSTESHPDDPFANPPTESPFADPHHETSVLNHPSPRLPRTQQSPTHSTYPAILVASSSFSRAPPTPKPLGLPPPRTPPPIDAPPRPTPPPLPTQMVTSERGDDRDTRWWHDWLCGCNEGPNRGGDYQAGRTNPFE